MTVSAAEEHPFFVYGGSWSSISPALSMARYNLFCSKLSLGDVCISLTNSRDSRMIMSTSANKEEALKTLPVSTSTSLSDHLVNSELAQHSGKLLIPQVHSPVTGLVSDSTSVTYSMSRPMPSSSELSVTFNVATGLDKDTGKNNADEKKYSEETEFRNIENKS